jgi:hypothetical protein
MIASSNSHSLDRARRWLGAGLTASSLVLAACSQADPSNPTAGTGGAGTGAGTTTGATTTSTTTTSTSTTTTSTSGGSGSGGASVGLSAALYTAEGISDVVVSGTTLFFLSSFTDPVKKVVRNRLYRASTAGGASQIVEEGSLERLTLGSDHVYWTSLDPMDLHYRIKSLPIAGGAPTIVTVVGFSNPGRFQVDANSVYYFTSTSVITHGIASTPLAGGAAQTVLAETDLGTQPSFVGVDATKLYYYAEPVPGADGFYSIPLAGGVPKVIRAIAGGLPEAAALGAANIYYAEFNGLDVLAAPLTGAKPTAVGKGAGIYSIDAIVPDGNDVYFADGTVLARIPGSGGATETLLKPDLKVFNIAVAPDALYWVGALPDQSQFGILKLAK